MPTTITAANITDGRIQRLRDEAAEAGDLEQVRICELALNGDEWARAECAYVIQDASAADDEQHANAESD